ncbi:MAG: sugar-binding protein, partial [Gammaproteobacteria bacterium]
MRAAICHWHGMPGIHSMLLLALLTPHGDGVAQVNVPDGAEQKTVQIVRTDTAPIIDGRLDEAVWLRAALVDDLHAVSPIEYAEPSEQTRVYLLYTEDALYVGARLSDSEPDAINAKILRQGESVFGDDFFAIVLDPFHDRRSGFRFEVNANGIRSDLLYQNTNQQLRDWDGIWEAAATQDEQGWTAEMSIPFKTLSFDPSNEVWGVNFMRFIPRRNEFIGWVSRNRTMNPSITGTVTGSNNLAQGVGLDIVPSISLHAEKAYSPSGSHSDREPSLDLFYKLTPGLNASLTLNTDFSATEVDDRQVDLSRFSLFFPEKRDFFLNDSDLFEFGRLGGREFGGPTFSQPSLENGRPFFSRRVGLSASGEPVDLNYGGKLSGRIGRWNVGALAIRQDAFENVDATHVVVGRVAANVLSESSLGALVTSGDPRSNLDNTVVGVDFRYLNSRLPGGRELQGEAWFQQSDTDGLDGDDQAFGLRLQMPNNTGFRAGIGIKELQQNFNPALGFVNRRGIRDQTIELGYTHRPTDSFLR